jgi:hypothetical protein
MLQITSQPLVSQKEPIKLPTLIDRLKTRKSKILLGFLIIFIFSGAVFGIYKLDQKQVPFGLQPESIRCEQNEDCALAIRLDRCCSCPKAISRQALGKDENLVEYELERDYSEEIKVDCQDVACEPCGLFPPKTACLNGICTLLQDEVAPTPNPTGNWQTYTNTKYGYSIKFPPDWGQGIEIAGFAKDGYSLTIGPAPIELLRPQNITITTSKVKVGDRDYLKSTWKFPDGRISFERIKLETEDNLEIVLVYKDGVYNKDYNQIFNLMLSTFKFFESKYKCATYTRGDSKEEHCAACGDGICEEFEKCTASSCSEPDVEGNVKCTTDCGGLWCLDDCEPEAKKFICPENNNVDCMPIIQGEKKWFCSEEYLNWAKQNCPKFIIAY